MFSSMLEEYRIHYIGIGNMPTTADQVIEKISRFLSAFQREYGVVFDGEIITGLTPRILHRWYDQMTVSGLKMTTKNNYVNLLNPFLMWAVENEYLVCTPGSREIYNVLKVNRLPKEDEVPESERKQKFLTVDQVRLLMNGVGSRNKRRDSAILALFFASGLRVSELCGLTIGSVLSQERGTIYLRRKGGSWKHTEVADFCYKYIEAYLTEEKSKGRDITDMSAPLFLTERGTPCSRQQLWEVISNKEKRLGLPTGVHILRHTTISNAEKKGGAGVARDIANHATISMTNKYDHTTHAERSEALNRLDWADL